MKALKFFLALSLTLIIGVGYAQEGILTGKIVDETTGESLFGATIVKQGTTNGTSSDFDGNYSLKLPVGTHSIVIQSVSFRTIVMDNIEIVEGETQVLDIVMQEDVQTLGAVTVTATITKDNDIGVMLLQKKSANTLDGISSASFRKVGDSNLSSAMKRVTGVSVQGDKYVYVRGLGDRYTKTSINGMVIPGLDPDRNDVQIDIFPTGILENVVVYKTFSPNLPGSFTGGLIDIQTKAFPEEKSTSISLGLGFNPSMHFNSNFLKYEGSSTDWLGFDNGARDLPVAPNTDIAGDNATTSQFDPTLGATQENNLLNTSLSFSHRNQVVGNKLTWGYNVLFTYRNRSTHYDEFEREQYERNPIGTDVNLVKDYSSSGALSSNEVLWSGLASIAAKSANTTIGTTFINIQNGTSSALKRTRRNTSLNNPTFLYNDILTYTERNMFNNITYGKHQLGKVRLEWTNSLILSNQYEPDYRETAINLDDDQLGFRNGGLINRFWRDLSELNESFKVDLAYDLNKQNTLKAGAAINYRNRSFNVYNYAYGNLLSRNVNSTDPNDLSNFIIDEGSNSQGLFVQNATDESNAYDGTQTITAAYAMNEMTISDRLKAVYGARIENVKMNYTGIVKDDNGIEVPVNNQETLNETNILPSASMIYSLNENMNLRASFNKTLARPSFREKSEAFIADPITGLFFIGNIDTKQAEILNYDLRWENFFRAGEMISASLFYKNFTNHIAIVAFEVAPNQVTPRNVGSAVSYGAEFEARKKLSFLGKAFTNFSTGGNLTYTISRVDRSTVIVSETGQNEYESDVNFRGSENGVDKFRSMSMQAPYSINAFLNYENNDGDISANMSYNVQGETLTYVSAAIVPEVYTQPFHSLNFKVSKKFGEELNSNLSLRIQNILDDNNELVYRTGEQSELFSNLNPGRTFTLSYSYSF
ncbi:MAG: TonB-dependent receptor [Cyclobacteriaceae bacterium]